VAVLLSFGAILAILFLLPGSAPLKGWLVVSVIVALAIFGLVNWRCPQCNAPLSRNFTLLRETCPQCGSVLNPDDSLRGMFRTLLRLLGGPPA
jgi:hypothetical protein